MSAHIRDLCQDDRDKLNSLVREVITLGREKNRVSEELGQTKIELQSTQEALAIKQQELTTALDLLKRYETEMQQFISPDRVDSGVQCSLTDGPPPLERKDAHTPAPNRPGAFPPTPRTSSIALDQRSEERSLCMDSATSASEAARNVFIQAREAARSAEEGGTPVFGMRRLKQIQGARLHTFRDAKGVSRGTLVPADVPAERTAERRTAPLAAHQQLDEDSDSDLESHSDAKIQNHSILRDYSRSLVAEAGRGSIISDPMDISFFNQTGVTPAQCPPLGSFDGSIYHHQQLSRTMPDPSFMDRSTTEFGDDSPIQEAMFLASILN